MTHLNIPATEGYCMSGERVSIFLSHTWADKDFVRKLALDLDCHGIRYWLDEAEIKFGQSLISKIREGIDEVDYVAVILSPRSVESTWVKYEVDVAMTQEIEGKRVKVIPMMIEKCELPGFLLGKYYADFTDESRYAETFKRLVEGLGVAFNRRALEASHASSTLGQATDRAVMHNLRILAHPFHRPFQYVGMTVSAVIREVGQAPGEGGHIVVENEHCYMLLEVEGNFVHFVKVDLKQTAPHDPKKGFDSEAILGALSINPEELELVGQRTEFHTYYDHKRKLKVTVSCDNDGGPINVSFGAKYYGD